MCTYPLWVFLQSLVMTIYHVAIYIWSTTSHNSDLYLADNSFADDTFDAGRRGPIGPEESCKNKSKCHRSLVREQLKTLREKQSILPDSQQDPSKCETT